MQRVSPTYRTELEHIERRQKTTGDGFCWLLGYLMLTLCYKILEINIWIILIIESHKMNIKLATSNKNIELTYVLTREYVVTRVFCLW